MTTMMDQHGMMHQGLVATLIGMSVMAISNNAVVTTKTATEAVIIRVGVLIEVVIEMVATDVDQVEEVIITEEEVVMASTREPEATAAKITNITMSITHLG